MSLFAQLQSRANVVGWVVVQGIDCNYSMNSELSASGCSLCHTVHQLAMCPFKFEKLKVHFDLILLPDPSQLPVLRSRQQPMGADRRLPLPAPTPSQNIRLCLLRPSNADAPSPLLALPGFLGPDRPGPYPSLNGISRTYEHVSSTTFYVY